MRPIHRNARRYREVGHRRPIDTVDTTNTAGTISVAGVIDAFGRPGRSARSARETAQGHSEVVDVPEHGTDVEIGSVTE